MNIDADFSDRNTLGTRPVNSGFGNDGDKPAKPERDLKRAFLIFGLGALSWVATYVGMLELIEANMGDLPLIHRVIIGFSVAMLMTMIIWLLDQLFKPHPFITKLFYASGYVFLSIISIGFGFGFYWKVLESHGEASRSAENAVGQVQNSLHAASTRLEQLQATLVQLTQVSTEKAELERTRGTSCPNSKPGDGPRRKMREEDAQRFSFASKFVEGRVGAVKGDMNALNGDLQKIVTSDISTIDIKSGTRNEFLRALGRKLDLTVTGFNAFRTDPQLRQMRTDLADRAEKTSFTDQRGGVVSCPDPQLQTALRGVVKAIDQLPELEKPQIAAVEGSEATIEAFRRLTTTFYGMLSFKMPPSADELRDLQKKAVQSVEAPAPKQLSFEQGGLSKRDYVPLAVALFVDICLFLVSMVSKPTNRLAGLLPKMQAAEGGPVIQILTRFNDIHKDRQIRENFEIFRHVVFDMNGDYFVAVPLDAPPRLNPQERENLRVEAQLLTNLFASFEKERIFKRAMLPTTSGIQKRLKRQGSKFASAEAFRLYKFTDGAWSDIILGAIMGAARRAENEGRRSPGLITRPMPATIPRGPAPVMVPPPAQALAPSPVRPPNPAPMQQAQPATHSNPRPTNWAGRPPRAPSAAAASKPTAPPDAYDSARYGPYAQFRQGPPQGLMSHNISQMPPRDPNAPQSPRVARSAPPPIPEAEVTVKAANSNSQPAISEAAVIVPLARPATPDTAAQSPNTVDVTLSRETATFSLPVSDANMPGSLRAAIAKAQAQASTEPNSQPVKAGMLLASEVAEDDEDLFEPKDLDADILSERDRALIGRMAPPAAE